VLLAGVIKGSLGLVRRVTRLLLLLASRREVEVLGLYGVGLGIRCRRGGADHGGLQIPHVVRPVIAAQRLDKRRLDLGLRARAKMGLQQARKKERNLVDALAQRRQAQADAVQSGIEIGAKARLSDSVGERLLNRCDQSDID